MALRDNQALQLTILRKVYDNDDTEVSKESIVDFISLRSPTPSLHAYRPLLISMSNSQTEVNNRVI